MNGGYGGPLAGENGDLCNFDRRRPWPGTMAGNDKVMENGKLDPVTPCTLLVRGVSLQVPATLVVWWESLGAFARWVELSPLVCSTIVFALRNARVGGMVVLARPCPPQRLDEPTPHNPIPN